MDAAEQAVWFHGGAGRRLVDRKPATATTIAMSAPAPGWPGEAVNRAESSLSGGAALRTPAFPFGFRDRDQSRVWQRSSRNAPPSSPTDDGTGCSDTTNAATNRYCAEQAVGHRSKLHKPLNRNRSAHCGFAHTFTGTAMARCVGSRSKAAWSAVSGTGQRNSSGAFLICFFQLPHSRWAWPR